MKVVCEQGHNGRIWRVIDPSASPRGRSVISIWRRSSGDWDWNVPTIDAFATRAEAIREAKRLLRRNVREARRTRVEERAQRYLNRMLALPLEKKIRHARRTPETRRLFQQSDAVAHVFDVHKIHDFQGMRLWLSECGIGSVAHGQPFAEFRSKGRRFAVIGDFIMFPTAQMAFEFRVRWQ